MGDFNLPSASSSSQESSFLEQFTELLNRIPLFNHVSKSTRYRGSDTPSLLDLILTNEELMIEAITHQTPLGRSDHELLDFRYVTHASTNGDTGFRTHIRTNLVTLQGLVQANDWTFPESLSADESWAIFTRRLETLILASSTEKMVRDPPKSKQCIRSRTRKWMGRKDSVAGLQNQP
jgi:hypothetical protein